MKKVRVFLSAVAILLAVGATFAVQPKPLLVSGFEYIISGGGSVTCRPIDDMPCQASGNNACTSPANYDVRRDNTETNCGLSWKKP